MTARRSSRRRGLRWTTREAVGALSAAAIREEDVRAGRFDGAAVRAWLVNWADVAQRRLLFRGSLGEIERRGQTFRAELRGLAEALNRPQGRVYQKPCSAVSWADARCGVDLAVPGLVIEAEAIAVAGGTELTLPGQVELPEGWFAHGRLRVMDGSAKGTLGLVKRDRSVAGQRVVELWEMLSAGFAPGDRVRLEAGCDKRASTCREKFSNFINFQGFPHIPGEDWLVSYPLQTGVNDGGSLGR